MTNVMLMQLYIIAVPPYNHCDFLVISYTLCT